jgi:hypothetical protein
MYMATIAYIDKAKDKCKEYYVYRKDWSEINEAVDFSKKILKSLNFAVIFTNIETIDCHFERDNMTLDDDVVFH